MQNATGEMSSDDFHMLAALKFAGDEELARYDPYSQKQIKQDEHRRYLLAIACKLLARRDEEALFVDFKETGFDAWSELIEGFMAQRESTKAELEIWDAIIARGVAMVAKNICEMEKAEDG